MYKRYISIIKDLEKKSHFLFGPRATGKTTLIRTQIPGALFFNLLNARTFTELAARPEFLAERIRAQPDIKYVVVDEIQKLPLLLDEIQDLMLSFPEVRFLLTGSSARKLKRGAANLLAGRAWERNLFPLTSMEIENFDLLTYLQTGGLPAIYASKHAKKELKAYVSLYIKEEIQAEALTRDLGAFLNFLDVAALNNGEELNFESVGSDCGVNARSVQNYFQILEDTLIGFKLKPFRKTQKRNSTAKVKFYFFDVGVAGALAKRATVEPKSDAFGKAFEHFIIQETRAALHYLDLEDELTYWRTTSQAQYEVDLLIGQRVAIEIKSADLIADNHLRSLRALKEENLFQKYICVSLVKEPRTTSDGIEILPLQNFLKWLWDGAHSSLGS